MFGRVNPVVAVDGSMLMAFPMWEETLRHAQSDGPEWVHR